MKRAIARIRALFRWRQLERDLHDELAAHLAMDAEERIASGDDPGQARAAARRDLGNLARVAEDTRASWGWARADAWLQDLRYAFRQVRRSPGHAAVVVTTL